MREGLIIGNEVGAGLRPPVAEFGYEDVSQLAKAAQAHIAQEEFVDGFSLLSRAQHRAALTGDRLLQEDAINLGNTLAIAGHVLYNYYVDADGQDLLRDHGPASDAAGRVKFQEAAEIFQYAVGNDPADTRAYFGLSDMQRELGQDSASTITQLETMLEGQPDKDTVEVRLEIVRHRLQQDGHESVATSYAKAIGLSINEPHMRHKVTRSLAGYLDGDHGIDADALQTIKSACLRAIILDPDDQHYRALLRHLAKPKLSV